MNIVAIDGASGAGKSTIAKTLSRKIGYNYLDTGALYRALAYHISNDGVDPKDEDAVKKSLANSKVSVKYKEGLQITLVDDEDVSDKIRTEEISTISSIIATYPDTREKLLGLQRQIAEDSNIIVDGRDIGTVVFPDAKYKYFVTATPEKKAERRVAQNKELGIESNYEDVLASIIERDKRDEEREIAPLKKAEGATIIDTTNQTIRESVDIIVEDIRADQPPQKLSLFYRFVRWAAVFFFFLFTRVRVEGMENIPKNDGYIVCPNHKSLSDIVVVEGILKKVNKKKKPYVLAKEELMKNKFMKFMFRTVGAYPVSRGSADIAPLEWATKHIQGGNILILFPEGTRSKDFISEDSKITPLLKPKSGVGLICAETRSDVLPISIFFEGNKVVPFKKITVRVGKMIKTEEFNFSTPLRSTERKQSSRLIMERIEEMYVKGHEK